MSNIYDETFFGSRGGSRAAATSKMERFEITVNGFAVNYHHKALHLACCSSPRSAYGKVSLFAKKVQHKEAVIQRCPVRKVFLKISQNSQENTCVRVSFLIKLQGSGKSFKRGQTVPMINDTHRERLVFHSV